MFRFLYPGPASLGRLICLKKLAVMAAALLLLASSARAAWVETGLLDYSLPVDFSPGMPARQANYVSDTVYQDPTLKVVITTDYYNGIRCWTADVEISDASQLRTVSAAGFDSNGSEYGTVLANRMNAVLAVDGDYYCYTADTPVIIRQGITYRNRLRKKPGPDVLLIDEDGNFHGIEDAREGDIGEEIGGRKIINAFCFGPLLVNNGSIRRNKTNPRMKTDQRCQRVAIAQTGPLKYRIIVTGPNARGSKGFAFEDWRRFVADMPDVQVAYNLDGGDSAVLVFNGMKINDPENTNERPLADIIYFASAMPR